MENKDVVNLQAELNKKGYECGKTDGILGEKTLSALKEYQKNKGKNTKEISDPKDWKKELKPYPKKEAQKVNAENCELAETINSAGFAYDPDQDIYYSLLDPWQRKYGYCHLYDELAISAGLVIDCEPIFFEYDKRSWMIELWKGQYCLSAGAEIGIYEKEKKIRVYDFYNCVKNKDLLEMSYSLKKKGKEIFRRKGKHWWLTGFKPGTFVKTSDLSMEISITLKDNKMSKAFINGLIKVGYPENKINVQGNNVAFVFGKPYTKQASSRLKLIEKYVQKNNKKLCKKFNKIKKKLNLTKNDPCRSIKQIMENSDEIKNNFMKIGKHELLYKFHDITKLMK